MDQLFIGFRASVENGILIIRVSLNYLNPSCRADCNRDDTGKKFVRLLLDGFGGVSHPIDYSSTSRNDKYKNLFEIANRDRSNVRERRSATNKTYLVRI